MRKLLLLSTFFSITPLFLVVLLTSLVFVTKNADRKEIANAKKTKVAFAALPTAQNVFEDTIKASDARVEILTQFFFFFFDNYPQAIATISKTLAEKYRDANGLVTPDQIQKMYTPSSNGSWANGVNHFIEVLQ
ncbi:MAG: hypothetical protein HZC02_00820 [Candidatus Levybacteria bacterium]|nr:hypothetical protein [Candidatus Levybacteria bacterium]